MNSVEAAYKIVVVGAGAVGGYFGALLVRAGLNVTFMVRPQTAAVLAKEGLSVVSPAGSFTVHPPVITESSQIASADLIILAVKCTDLSNALQQVAPLVETGATLLTLQNGVDSEERVLAYFKNRDCLVAGVAYITARLAQPGVIEHYRRGILSLGEIAGGESPRAQKIYEQIAKTGIPCHLTRHIQREKWEKLCWNATFNPLSVILEHPISLILQSESLLEIVRQAVREVIAVAAAEGHALHPDIIEKTLSVSHDLADYHTSMYEDYKNKKPTEIKHINGDIILRGRKHGVATPVNQTLYALVTGLEGKESLSKA